MIFFSYYIKLATSNKQQAKNTMRKGDLIKILRPSGNPTGVGIVTNIVGTGIGTERRKSGKLKNNPPNVFKYKLLKNEGSSEYKYQADPDEDAKEYEMEINSNKWKLYKRLTPLDPTNKGDPTKNMIGDIDRVLEHIQNVHIKWPGQLKDKYGKIKSYYIKSLNPEKINILKNAIKMMITDNPISINLNIKASNWLPQLIEYIAKEQNKDDISERPVRLGFNTKLIDPKWSDTSTNPYLEYRFSVGNRKAIEDSQRYFYFKSRGELSEVKIVIFNENDKYYSSIFPFYGGNLLAKDNEIMKQYPYGIISKITLFTRPLLNNDTYHAGDTYNRHSKHFAFGRDKEGIDLDGNKIPKTVIRFDIDPNDPSQQDIQGYIVPMIRKEIGNNNLEIQKLRN